MGLFDELTDIAGGFIGLVGGLTVGTLSAALGVSADLVQKAVDSGCKTKEEVEQFIRDM